MVRKRLAKNKGLPTRCRWIGKYIYYDVPKGQERHWNGKKLFKVGKTVAEAFKVLAERIEERESAKNIGALIDRYVMEVTPTKAPRTAKNDAIYAQTLRKVFGDLPKDIIEPKDIYKYYDIKSSKVVAKKEIAFLSHVFTKAVEWGEIRTHPFKGQIRLKGSKPRDRYIEDWEIEECLKLEPKPGDTTKVIHAYIRLKILTGLRGNDMLSITMADLTEQGIYVRPRKTQNSTGKRYYIAWTPELREVIEQAKKARQVDISPYLFCTRRGLPYINEETGEYSGWNSIWQRFMKRVLAETKVTERFTSHDIRAKTASDTDTEHGSRLLGHADSRITERVYRRKTEVIQPLK